MQKLRDEFYNRADVVQVAQELLGKILVSCADGIMTSGRIVETEAYKGFTDGASHAYEGRRTARNEAMYAKAGTLYVYICYGMHQMVNVVTNGLNQPDAVLIRAVEPLNGMAFMQERTGKTSGNTTITRGPGNVAKALGINKSHGGLPLSGSTIYLADDGFVLSENQLAVSRRIGIDGAGAEAIALPWRFYVRGNANVSGKRG